MPQVINPIFETTRSNPFASTKHRFFTMFTPIQACSYHDVFGNTKQKQSDFTAYFINPLVDSFLEPMFAIDAAIHMLNAIVSANKALYLWSMTQQNTEHLIDTATSEELNFAISSICRSFSADIAQGFNLIFSLLSLFTRPIASAVQLAIDFQAST